MKIVICGGSGQLGSDCARVLRQKHEVMALGSKELDITNMGAVLSLLGRVAPDVVLNCAAFTRVDECETKETLAWKVNVEGAKNLALAAAQQRSRFIHISTDYVFDGRKAPPAPYTEDDVPNPLSCYGKTKLESEKVVQRISDRHVILRTAWLYGINGFNFLKTMLGLALKDPKREIKVVNDQFGSPTWCHRLALQIDRLIEVNGHGTYHATAEGYCTWFELARYFLERMGLESTVIPCTTDEYPRPASRPRNSILDNQRLKQRAMNLMRDWRDDLDRFVSDFRDNLLEEVD